MNFTYSGTSLGNSENQLVHSAECIRSSLHAIRQSNSTIQACADLVIMVQSALQDEAVVRAQFKVFYEKGNLN